MVKRIASAVLWFLAIGWGMNFVAAFGNLPQLPGLIIAVAVAAYFGFDPLRLVWAEKPETVEVTQAAPAQAAPAPRTIRHAA